VLAFKTDRQPVDQFGYLVFSETATTPGVTSGAGRLCTLPLKRLNDAVRRSNENGTCYAGTAGHNAPYTDNAGVTGFNANPYDTCNNPAIQSIGGFSAGNTYYFQWWYRDGAANWNFSDLREVTF